jgi:hypothetical protein
MLRRAHCLLLSALVFLIVTPSVLHARSGSGDRVQVGRSIIVEENENAGDLVCIGCSIRVAGTCGDVVVVGGSMIVDGTVKGDAVVVGGGLRMGENATVAGDVVTVGGRVRRHPNATIQGEVTSRSGALVLLGLVLVPLLPVVLVVALIVWLVSRSHRPAPVRSAKATPRI